MTSACVAPEWYKKLNARGAVRRRLISAPGPMELAEMAAVRKMRATLEAESDELARAGAAPHSQEGPGPARRQLVEAIKSRTMALDRLAAEALEAATTGKYEEARETKRLIKQLDAHIFELCRGLLDPFKDAAMGRAALLASQLCTLTAIGL